MRFMRDLVAAALTATLAVSCANAAPPDDAQQARSASTATSQASAAPVASATPTPSPTPTATPITEVSCADLDAFLDRIRPARVAAAGPVASPAPVPTVPPPNVTQPPLGQYVLAESPIYPFTQSGFDGFLRTSQDMFGPDAWGQSRELAVQNGLLWAYSRSFLAGSQPGGLLVYVHEFWSVDGALSFDEGATRNACLYGGSVFEIPGISGAIGQRFRNGTQYALRATFVKSKRRYTTMLTTTTLMAAEEIAYAARFAVAVAR
jgi:hypothetical protein